MTRTVWYSNPPPEFIFHNTLVLKGHINLAETRFPDGIKGDNIDMMARKPLWDNGLDFGHGTGHGVGYYLNIHEGPSEFKPSESRIQNSEYQSAYHRELIKVVENCMPARL